jgi:DNA-3-methyladenine glycosylase II
MAIQTLTEKSIVIACEQLSANQQEFAKIHQTYGTPPLWERPKGFATLVHIILEQQVSLASAKACFNKLERKIEKITPENLINLTDSELKSLGFSRQKTAYTKHLADAVMTHQINLENLETIADEDVKCELKKLKGIGDWSADIYLLMALLRPDVMPKGDLALHIAWQKISNSPNRPTSDEFLIIAEKWKPFRATAARLLWHFYLSEKRQKP